MKIFYMKIVHYSSCQPRYDSSPRRGGGGGGGRGGRRDDRDDPEPNKVREFSANLLYSITSILQCLGVFGLSLYTSEKELEAEFKKFGPLDKVQVVLDGHTGRSRGFAFIYFENIEDATEARDAMTGAEMDGRKIRVDYSITKRAHTPTPGMYMGRPTTSGR